MVETEPWRQSQSLPLALHVGSPISIEPARRAGSASLPRSPLRVETELCLRLGWGFGWGWLRGKIS
jgi:hypothetical protein